MPLARPVVFSGLWRTFCVMGKLKRLGFQGELGAYSHCALSAVGEKLFPHTYAPVPLSSFEALVKAVNTHAIDYAFLPIENALTGTVVPAFQALQKCEASIQGEYALPIAHALLIKPEAKLSDIREVYSHPQALSQCQHFIDTYGWQAKAYFDTAGAAKWLSQQNSVHCAAIASPLAAKYYHLKILKEGIADEDFNQTRFFILGNEPLSRTEVTQYKSSLLIGLKDRPSALLEILKIFCAYQLNLNKIESHPSRQRAWEYQFFINFTVSKPQLASLPALFKELADKTEYCKHFGNFPEGNITGYF